MLLQACIVDQNVERPHLRNSFAHQPTAFIDHADIGSDKAGPPPELANLLKGLLGLFAILPAIDDQIGTSLSQAHGNAAPDSLSAAGNQRYPVL